jgi:hypothetical protein
VGYFVEGLRDVVEVASVESGDGDTSVHSQVNGEFLTEFVDLVFVEASECKHANLVGDVGPIMLITESFKLVTEAVSHLVHAARHILEVLVPHCCQFGVSQDNVDNSGSVNGWVRVDWSCDLLDAGLSDLCLFLRAADN